MKKYLVIIALFFSYTSFGQVTVAGYDSTGRPGKKIVLKSTYYNTPLYTIDDTTVGSHGIDSLKIAPTNDTVFGRHDGVFVKQFILPLSSGWSLSGNTGSSNIFGLTSNNSIRFYTNNSLVAWLDSLGRFGVGATAPLAKMDIQSNGIGVTNTMANSILFENTTAATSGNPQWSPRLILSGNQWNAIGSLSQNLSFYFQTRPLSGSNVQGAYYLFGNTNGGSDAQMARWDLKTAQFSTGPIAQTDPQGSGLSNTFATPISLTNSTTNRYIQFSGTSSVSFGQNNTSKNLTFRVPWTSAATQGTTGNQALDIDYLTGATIVNAEAIDTGSVFSVKSTNGLRGSIPFPVFTTAQRNSINMHVVGFTITSGGTGYTSVPNISVSGTYPDIAGIFSGTISGGALTTITIVRAGSYSSGTQTVSIVNGGGTGASATVTLSQGNIPTGMTIFCSDCTATDSSTGVTQTWNGTSWKNYW